MEMRKWKAVTTMKIFRTSCELLSESSSKAFFKLFRVRYSNLFVLLKLIFYKMKILKVFIQCLIFGSVAGLLILSASQFIWSAKPEDDFDKFFDTVELESENLQEDEEKEVTENENILPVAIGDTSAA